MKVCPVSSYQYNNGLNSNQKSAQNNNNINFKLEMSPKLQQQMIADLNPSHSNSIVSRMKNQSRAIGSNAVVLDNVVIEGKRAIVVLRQNGNECKFAIPIEKGDRPVDVVYSIVSGEGKNTLMETLEKFAAVQ